MRKLLNLFRCITVMDDKGVKYIKRWYILKTPLLSIYVHNILEDDDADMHDHPWPFMVLILKGGYIEEIPSGSAYLKPLDIILHKPSDKHRIVLIKKHTQKCTWCGLDLNYFGEHSGYCNNGGCEYQMVNRYVGNSTVYLQDSWSLVILGPKVREWGFHTKQGWVHFKQYVGKKFHKGCE